MTQKQAIKGLLTQAEHNAEAAQDMFASGHYDWCLFLWHLVIEKTLKALYIKYDQTPPYIHNLNKLIEGLPVEITQQKEKQLKNITSFHIDARYDDYKLNFYKKATQKYAKKWSQISQEIYTWLLKQF